MEESKKSRHRRKQMKTIILFILLLFSSHIYADYSCKNVEIDNDYSEYKHWDKIICELTYDLIHLNHNSSMEKTKVEIKNHDTINAIYFGDSNFAVTTGLLSELDNAVKERDSFLNRFFSFITVKPKLSCDTKNDCRYDLLATFMAHEISHKILKHNVEETDTKKLFEYEKEADIKAGQLLYFLFKKRYKMKESKEISEIVFDTMSYSLIILASTEKVKKKFHKDRTKLILASNEKSKFYKNRTHPHPLERIHYQAQKRKDFFSSWYNKNISDSINEFSKYFNAFEAVSGRRYSGNLKEQCRVIRNSDFFKNKKREFLRQYALCRHRVLIAEVDRETLIYSPILYNPTYSWYNDIQKWQVVSSKVLEPVISAYEIAIKVGEKSPEFLSGYATLLALSDNPSLKKKSMQEAEKHCSGLDNLLAGTDYFTEDRQKTITCYNRWLVSVLNNKKIAILDRFAIKIMRNVSKKQNKQVASLPYSDTERYNYSINETLRINYILHLIRENGGKCDSYIRRKKNNAIKYQANQIKKNHWIKYIENLCRI